MTNQIKGYPFEVPVPAGCGVKGVILADHLKSLDWSARQAAKVGRVPLQSADSERGLGRLAPLLGY